MRMHTNSEECSQFLWFHGQLVICKIFFLKMSTGKFSLHQIEIIIIIIQEWLRLTFASNDDML